MAQNILRNCADVFQVFAHSHTALFTANDLSLTAATCMNLCFYNRKAVACLRFNLPVSFFGSHYSINRNAFLNMYIVFFQQFFRLKFVKVHSKKLYGEDKGTV